ncbi:unnamed protein product [Scytosiphon promiscuus]
MGIGASHQTKLDREFGDVGDGDGQERFFGLENFGNTCYCNSVLQALYFCEPLRQHLAQVREEDANGLNGGGNNGTGKPGGGSGSGGGNDNSVLSQLAELFSSISNQKRRSGHLAPTEFLHTLRQRNELFRGNMQQDAHEFFNFVLNDMADTLVARKKRQQEAAAVLEHKRGFQQNGSHHRRQAQAQGNTGGAGNQANLQQQDPRRPSAWSKMPYFKGGFGGNGPKNGSQQSSSVGSTEAGTEGTEASAVSTPRGGGDGGETAAGAQGAAAAAAEAGAGANAAGDRNRQGDGSDGSPGDTWIHRIFQGVLTNQTKCLCCETVSNRDEPFMDLSLDVEQNSSVSACLRNFSSTETLTKKNKFFCESCHALQEAEKKIRLKRLPRVLTLHLKRFKYVESLENFAKLSHRVVFPLELRTPNMTDEAGEADADGRLYRLFAVVVHIGRGLNHGHYVAVVKSGGRWLLFDDEIVELVNEQVLKQCFGLARPASTATNTGYLLLYDCGE